MARAARLGALCYDSTFTRVLGTRGTSEPILKDLVGAWRAAREGGAARASDGGGVDVEILESKVRSGAATPPVRIKGHVVADVRLRGGEDSFLVDVQHRVEPLFPGSALLYASSAKLVSQHLAETSVSTATGVWPVHTLAFCDLDFASGRSIGGVGTTLRAWRKASPPLAPRTERVVHAYSMQPCADVMARLAQQGNKELDAELAPQTSIVFALLPHAPRLQDLTAATPPLLRWASLVAHVAPDNVDAVPKAVRSEGVERLMSLLRETVDDTEAEREEAEREEADFQRSVEAAVEEALIERRAKAEAMGNVEGIAKVMRALGVESIADFRAKIGSDPPADLAAFFKRAA